MKLDKFGIVKLATICRYVVKSAVFDIVRQLSYKFTVTLNPVIALGGDSGVTLHCNIT